MGSTLTVLIGAFVLASLQLGVVWLDDRADATEALEEAQLAFARGRVHVGLVEDVVARLVAR